MPEEQKKNLGCSIVMWAGFAVLAFFVILFAYKVWYFSDKLRKGEAIDLPQYESHFTRAGGAVATGVSAVDRAAIETADNPELGSAAAKLTIVEFADFECPYSKDTANVIRKVMAKYGDKVNFIYRDYPLTSIHANARPAALAAECAREQGKFWEYHDKLYGNAPALSYADLLRYGKEVGLEEKQFESCVAGEKYKEKVDADTAAAQKLGIAGTPTFFFDGVKVEGAIPEEIFEAVIQRLGQ